MCSGSDRRGVFKKGQRWKRVSPAPGWVSSLVGEGMIVANGWCGNSLDFPGQSWSSPWETRKRSCESAENPCGLQSTGCKESDTTEVTWHECTGSSRVLWVWGVSELQMVVGIQKGQSAIVGSSQESVVTALGWLEGGGPWTQARDVVSSKDWLWVVR